MIVLGKTYWLLDSKLYKTIVLLLLLFIRKGIRNLDLIQLSGAFFEVAMAIIMYDKSNLALAD